MYYCLLRQLVKLLMRLLGLDSLRRWFVTPRLAHTAQGSGFGVCPRSRERWGADTRSLPDVAPVHKFRPFV